MDAVNNAVIPNPAASGNPPAAGAPAAAVGGATISLDGLDASLKADKTIASLAGKPVVDALRMLSDAQSLIGRKGSIIPTDPKDQATTDAYFRAVGWPETPDKYPAVTLPAGVEADPEMDKTMRAWAHELRMTPQQYQGLQERIAGWNVAEAKADAEKKKADSDKAVAALKTELGPQYESAKQVSRTAAAAFMDEAMLQRAQEKGWFDDPDFVKYTIAVGRAVSPDRLHASSAGGQVDAAGIQRQIDELMRSPAYQTERGPTHDRVLEDILQLRRQLTGVK